MSASIAPVPSSPAPAAAGWRRSPLLWPILGLVLLVVVNVIDNPAFLRIGLVDGHLFGTPVDIFNQGARTMLLALGMTLVIATGGVDLSVGSIVALAGSAAAVALAQHELALPLAVLLALGVSLLAGTLNGLLVARVGVQPIVATLILMVAGRGAAQLVTGGEVVLVAHPGFAFLNNGYVFGVPFAPLLVLALFIVTHLVLRRTAAGLFLEAVGDNETAAHFAGLNAARVKVLAYVICGLAAGICGLLAASNIRAADPYRAGEYMELDAIFAVVVGGTALTGGRFALLGSLIGALLLQTLTTTMYNLGVPPAVAPVPKALVILLVCLLQSPEARKWATGLLGGGRKRA